MHTSALASTASSRASAPVGHLLREWRQRRRLSQLELAGDAGISTRHLSCMETGRALPSRSMVLKLAERLAVPLRERNALLTAAGYAAVYRERPLDDPALQSAREALELVLHGHEPYPALLVDRHWNLVSANRVVPLLLAGLPDALLTAPINVLRLSLHPDGLAPRIENRRQWRAHVLARLDTQVAASADATLAALRDELAGFPVPAGSAEEGDDVGQESINAVVVPLRLKTPDGTLSFISTTTVFGTPVDITLSELALETLFPADAFTAQALRNVVAALPTAD